MSQSYNIHNDSFIVEITSLGAEMKRLYSKTQRRELLWPGDPVVWNRSSPVLFPIVGRLKDSSYVLDGKSYQMSQHGFARDMNFDCIFHNEDRVEFTLKATGETFTSYPYCFELNVIYELCENKLLITYNVRNDDRQDIFFSIGAHPGFLTPKVQEYQVRFESLESEYFYLKDGLVDWSEKEQFSNREINLSSELFNRDALIFKNVKSKSIDLIHLPSKMGLRMRMDAPYFGIWAKASAPFVCLEPWFGVSDEWGHDKNFRTKLGIQCLREKETFNFSYSLEAFEE